MKNLVRLLMMLSLTASVNVYANQDPPIADITGGAALIFKRPENPTSRANENATGNKNRSGGDDTGDKVDDAIALGNAARDRNPPDFESAEKAYRLGWKLNPRDPRPYLGLGNIYWDQRRYPEAAKAYRDALSYTNARIRAVSGEIVGGSISGTIPKIATQEFQYGQTRLYLAAALLQEDNPLSAEKELRLATLTHSDNAEWNGLFGYTLTLQRRYTEAIVAYVKAGKLAPNNSKYKELLNEATQKARETSAHDQAITTRMQNTMWEVRDATSSTVKGTCQLDASGSLRCAGRGLTLLNGTWRIRDGIFNLQGAFPIPFCVGPVHAATIQLKCFSSTTENSDVWVKLPR
jgi:Flp pilus assembly protein TadD